VDRLFANELKRSLCVHRQIDRRLFHVEDETPVAIAAEDDAAHALHSQELHSRPRPAGAAMCVCAVSSSRGTQVREKMPSM